MGNQEAEGDVPESSPKEKSGSESGSAKWIKDITAFVALLGTIVGVAISIWGLVEKSKVDKETAQQSARQAEVNRRIAEDQIAAHRAEYEFQGQQHDKDRMYQDQEHQREQQIAEAQRLSTIIDGLFSGAANSEGKIDLLSAYVTPDHRNDSIIANALIAKLDNPQSHAEIAAACLDAGKYVYCEKPLGITPEQVAFVLRASRRANVFHCTGGSWMLEYHRWARAMLLRQVAT